MDDAIASKWFYDDRVLSEENLVRAEKRAVVRRPRHNRRFQHHGAANEEDEEGAGEVFFSLSNKFSSRDGAEAQGEAGVGPEGPKDRPGESLLFWDWDPAMKARGAAAAPSCSQTYEVDAATLEMIQACLQGYQQNIEDAIAATEEAEACTSKDAEARWIAVNDSEKIEKSISELQKQSLNAQRDFSTARSHLLNTETELRQLEQENESAAAANEKESRTVSRDWVTRNGRKSEKEQMLHELQEEYSQEMNAKEDILQNREGKIESEVNLCRSACMDLARNLTAAEAKLRTLREATAKLRDELERTEESLNAANKDYRMLRNAQRVEDAVLAAELAMTGMDDSEIGATTRTLITEVNTEIEAKKQLKVQIRELRGTVAQAAGAVAAGKMEEVQWEKRRARLLRVEESEEKREEKREEKSPDVEARETATPPMPVGDDDGNGGARNTSGKPKSSGKKKKHKSRVAKIA